MTLSRRLRVLASCALAAMAFAAHPAVARGIEVAKHGAVATLGAALHLARDGDEIVIQAGTYEEHNLVVDHAVTIRGVGAPVITARGRGHVLIIRASGVSICDLTLAETGRSDVDDRAAVKLIGARDCVLERVSIRDAFFGIYLSKSARCRISGCDLRRRATSESASGNGIHSWGGDSLIIENNTVEGHRDGIYLEFTKHTLVTGNLSRGNLRYGLHFMFSDDNRYERNRFERNGSGVAVMYTHRVHMRGNTFSNNWGGASYGLLLKEIVDSEIEDNVFERNTTGIFAEGGARLAVRGNVFRGNGWAVRLMANCDRNEFTGNSFFANTFDVATNSTRSTSRFNGNHWDAYRGYDLNRDGIGDIPYKPVRVFSSIVENNPPAIVLLNSFIVGLLDVTERVLPTLTSVALSDGRPLMKPAKGIR